MRYYTGGAKLEAISSFVLPKSLKFFSFFIQSKTDDEYQFNTNYNGSSKSFKNDKTQRRKMNGYLKLIAKCVGINITRRKE
ncbi:hypothetical protein GCM10007383_37470 [Arenibacter certesii]|uniref:Uncharacterized protein n=1 Tax=Arenibacter certesii TaxID=228955 RepID=A0A918J5Q4_9FLAO|nr:hypothetical protein GCM10007383_37470 [Arenibacter certesii]